MCTFLRATECFFVVSGHLESLLSVPMPSSTDDNFMRSASLALILLSILRAREAI